MVWGNNPRSSTVHNYIATIDGVSPRLSKHRPRLPTKSNNVQGEKINFQSGHIRRLRREQGPPPPSPACPPLAPRATGTPTTTHTTTAYLFPADVIAHWPNNTRPFPRSRPIPSHPSPSQSKLTPLSALAARCINPPSDRRTNAESLPEGSTVSLDGPGPHAPPPHPRCQTRRRGPTAYKCRHRAPPSPSSHSDCTARAPARGDTPGSYRARKGPPQCVQHGIPRSALSHFAHVAAAQRRLPATCTGLISRRHARPSPQVQ